MLLEEGASSDKDVGMVHAASLILACLGEGCTRR